MAFYDLTAKERIALTERAMEEKRTVHERWNALDVEEAGPWKPRSAVAAKLLDGVSSVADFGCGTMALESYLGREIAYFPIDVVRRDARTLVCDLNIQPPPKSGAEAAVCLGILEYVLQPEEFIAHLKGDYSKCVISYNVNTSAGSTEQRRSDAWVNDLTRAQIEDMFMRSGWRIHHSQQLDENQIIWLLC